MGMHLHVATKYDVEFQEVYVDCTDYVRLIWDLHEQALELFGVELVVWNNEYEDMFELDKATLEDLSAVCQEHGELLKQWVSVSPEYNDFVRIEIY
jgi:hypothetical protein